jgi:hypothetical protein
VRRLAKFERESKRFSATSHQLAEHVNANAINVRAPKRPKPDKALDS